MQGSDRHVCGPATRRRSRCGGSAAPSAAVEQFTPLERLLFTSEWSSVTGSPVRNARRLREGDGGHEARQKETDASAYRGTGGICVRDRRRSLWESHRERAPRLQPPVSPFEVDPCGNRRRRPGLATNGRRNPRTPTQNPETSDRPPVAQPPDVPVATGRQPVARCRVPHAPAARDVFRRLVRTHRRSPRRGSPRRPRYIVAPCPVKRPLPPRRAREFLLKPRRLPVLPLLPQPRTPGGTAPARFATTL